MVVVCSLVGGLVSLIGGILLLRSKKRAKLVEYATSFAAGALLSAAFIDVIPEAMEGNDEPHMVSVFILLGILVFFIFESSLRWFHHHHTGDDRRRVDAVVPMIIVGDTIHNFIDGVAIAAGFLTSVETGIVVTLAVAAHEIPQEIGDFGLLLQRGMSKVKVLLVNILSALATTVAAVVFYLIGETVEISFAPLMAIVAGFFIYIAASDLIPHIHHEENRRKVFLQTLALVIGVVVVWVAVAGLHWVVG